MCGDGCIGSMSACDGEERVNSDGRPLSGSLPPGSLSALPQLGLGAPGNHKEAAVEECLGQERDLP